MAADWHDQFQQGSWNGTPFLVLAVASTIGRRTITRELPGADVASGEDQGRRARRFTVTCVVIGAGYMADRDALIEALETAGPATLVHPYWGTRTVQLDGEVSVNESTDEGGQAAFSFPCVEVQDTPFADLGVDPGSDLTDAAGAADVADDADDAAALPTPPALAQSLVSSFADAFAIAGLIAASAGPILAAIDDAVGALSDAHDALASVFGLVDSFAGAAQTLLSDAATLATTPYALAAQILGLATQISGLVNSIAAAETQLGTSAATSSNWTTIDSSTGAAASALVPSASTGAVSAGSPLPSSTTSAAPASPQIGPAGGAPLVDTRISQAVLALAQSLCGYVIPPTLAEQIGVTTLSNDQQVQIACGAALQRLINLAGIVCAADALPTVPFASAADAIAFQSAMFDLLDAAELNETDSDTWRSLEGVRVAAANFLSSEATDLPEVVAYTPPTTLPALVCAWQAYGDPTRETELIARNLITNPANVPGGIPLEVLSG